MTITKVNDAEAPARQLGIRSETDRLQYAAVWGRPSVEAALTQLYPTNVSLFLDSMDVQKAGKEMAAYTALLRSNGVEVVEIKDVVASLLPESTRSKNDMLKSLFYAAEEIQIRYPSSKHNGAQIADNIVALLEQDMAQYGAPKAFALAEALCLETQMPMGNIIYARDHTNVVFGGRIVSNMAEPIRMPEVALYEMAYEHLFGSDNAVKLSSSDKFEGGDLYIHGNTVFIGVGVRTSRGAALDIFSRLALYKPDLTFAIVMNGKLDGTFKEIQESMHLDTFSMPIGENQMAVCEQEANKRHVYIVKVHDDEISLKETNLTFTQYLEREMGYSLTVVSKEGQTSFGCNMLMLDSQTAFVPKAQGAEVITKLQAAGKNTVEVDLDAVTNGFGATHCAVAQLRRE